MELPANLSYATELLVILDGGYDPRRRARNTVLHREQDGDVISCVAGVLAGLDGPRADWMELPETSLVFLKERSVLAEYGVLSGGWVRTPSDGDRAERSGELMAWLAHVKVKTPHDS